MAKNKKTRLECNECEAVYDLKFDLDKDYYKPNFCPFCGGEITNETFDIEENDDEET